MKIHPQVLTGLLLLVVLLGGAPASAEDSSPLIAPLGDGVRLDFGAVLDDVPRPSDFLGYPLGRRFTPHARQLAYFEALDTASDRVTTFEYGTSYQGRPLRLLVLSSPANLARLEEIRLANLRLADPAESSGPNGDELKRSQPAVVWLAFGVHGNETASPEAAMAIAYQLAAAGAGSDVAQVLDNTVVLLDPQVNPDGHERYVAFYQNAAGPLPNPDLRSLEHHEGWPNGRSNHFQFDLNRDWAWATQQETRDRLAAYRSWEPHVYVDFHEMNVEETYFFPPAADPVHPLLEGNGQEWLETFGRANADAFDENGWLYFIREAYDLFYPGYGDTYPSLRGAVGMTYEVGGSGLAGLAVELPNGETKTLADRVARHVVTGLATLRTASAKRRDLVRDFAERRNARLPPATYLFAAGQSEARAMADLLASHGLEVRTLGQNASLRVASLMPAGEVERSFPAGTYAVSTRQPLGRLLRAVMDAEANLTPDFVERQEERVEDGLGAEIYDITGWSLPLAYNVETWIYSGEVAGTRALREPVEIDPGEGGIGYLVRPQGVNGYRLAFALLGKGLRIRFVGEAIDGDEGTRGAFFVPRSGQVATFDAAVRAEAKRLGVALERVASSWQEMGPSLGSAKLQTLRAPRVALVGGPGIDTHSFGFAWQLMAETMQTPVLRLDVTRLGDASLAELDVIVLPDGSYNRAGDNSRARLDAFARAGGRLLAIGGAVAWLRETGLVHVTAWQPNPGPVDDPDRPGTKRKERELPLPGVVLASEILGRHDLTAGLATPPPWLFAGGTILNRTGDPTIDVMGIRRDDPLLAGLLWSEAAPRVADALLVARENIGRGDVVIFAQDPNFRGYWRGTMPLFLNALLGVH